ncbi:MULTISPECIES: lysozyme inhibitor LprI family protein [Novosphingobium]|jgi:uncharacterized protein|uniref:lysozyme inhibitor LprI family protein n=2 Tax=Sphingomonadaceae TaxID=41297 RepID=UPI0022F25055|nr:MULTISPECIES: hypothetical protein [Novosphingobium]GLK45796.1 hypothetical protein GCM10017612_37160 [Novosphingobium resinovorum]
MKAAKHLAACWGLAITASLWALSAHAQGEAAHTDGPSFSCTAARTAMERAICTDPALAVADREMAALFALSRESAFGTGPSSELAAQRQALKRMRGCEGAEIRKCLKTVYAERNGALAIAALMHAPDQALPVLRRLDPQFAPVLEAVALWAREPVDTDWSAPERAVVRTRITALLFPYLTRLSTDEGQSFGWSILSEPYGDSPKVRTTGDLFTSERHFAAFLNVLGPYLDEDANGIERNLPCGAIVRHPALIEATESVFGSTMDNFVLRNDCEQTLPPTPALDTLAARIRGTWPDCDGTIRFAAYRSYQTALDRARLGQAPHEARPEIAAPDGVPTAAVETARSELGRYYAVHLGKSAKDAATMATDAISGVVSTAHSCGT